MACFAEFISVTSLLFVCALAMAAPFFEGIIDRQRVVPHETIWAICTNVAAAKQSFHVMYRRAADM
jgi:hypothetical protein